jgi:hypothetical protein
LLPTVQSVLVLPVQVCAAAGTALRSAMTDTAVTIASRGVHIEAGVERAKPLGPGSTRGAASETASTAAHIIEAPQSRSKSMPDYDSILAGDNPTFAKRSC